ncbi:helix-turn-helix domain-containing protein [Thermoactinomyces mirandus]|uniref:Helix-turn-helix domain-containing protein n=1 Tax=Thermoactinomyces mirandus TaxID=2756294 RepID=A0A7W1XUW5_9BACL|nr:helix-turn-helix transcriptional regulator [Thermoactinomyces mirandus]MBA4603738.1 helix-turn-helix domain-containing protein [Thermoactinomyces mirandus]
MAGIGDYLKQVRQQRGYSLEEMNRLTNIHTKYLYLLENDRFDLLPSPFYAKAFLRTYAKSLGIDAKPLLDHLDKLLKNKMPSRKPVRNTVTSPQILPRYNKNFLPTSPRGKLPEGSVTGKASYPGDERQTTGQNHYRNQSAGTRHNRMNMPMTDTQRIPVMPNSGMNPNTNPNMNNMNPNTNPNIRQNLQPPYMAPKNVSPTTGPQHEVPQSTMSFPPLEATQQHLLTPRSVAMAAKELQNKGKKVTLRKKRYKIIAIAVGALLLLGGGFYYFFMDHDKASQSTNNNTATTDIYSGASFENVNAESKKTPALVEGEASTDPKVGQTYLIRNVDKLEVVLKGRSGTSTLLYAPTPNDKPKELTLKERQTVTLDTAGKNYIWFRLGTPSNVEILVNGQQINTDAQDAEKSYIVKVE